MKIFDYHKKLETLHVNCEKPRAYYIPYQNEVSALSGKRDASDYFMNLSGEWNFKFYNSFEDIEENFLEAEFTDTIPVPKCWQTQLGKGYDVPLYSNLFYPFPLDPPHVPDENPCGHYNRKVNIEKKGGKKYYINFEGVSSCFYLYVNGIFAAYSQVSHCTSEVDITDLLVDGENAVDVLVVKWCDGSYLEDQDYFRLSGIFREVYILERSSNISDVYIKTALSDDLSSGRLTADIVGEYDFEYKLLAPNGETVASGCGDMDIAVSAPLLWSSENPMLYTLLVSCKGEVIPFKIGFKKIEFRGNVAYVNNQPVKLYGINRHDSHPETGYWCNEEHMINDLNLLKRGNCNTIRTSHYPNAPRFLELCDEWGFMVIDEADIETHGMGFEYRDTWDWMRWSKLSTDDEWEEAYVDRAARLFERDKNHGCVIMWSLGNESGCGKNHRAMRNYIKSRDSKAIVHYENAHLEFKAVPIGENYSDISDVESRMYASLDYTKKYCENKNSKKPFYFCEYVCSMTTGDIHAHVDMFRKYPALWGGCIWELTDHTVKVADNAYRYGGDFGDYPNNSVCCIDGLVFPDRSERPGFADMKKAYQPFETKFENGKLSVFNRRFFESLNDLYIEWKLEINGECVKSGRIDETEIAPQSEKSFDILDSIPESGCCFLTVYFKEKNAKVWADADFEVGFDQFDLSVAENKTALSTVAPAVEEGRRFVKITAGNVIYTFDKSYGCISSVVADGEELLSEPAKVEIWKAHGYNQLGDAEDRKSAAMQAVIQKTYETVIEKYDNCVDIICSVSIGGPAVVPVLKGSLIYRFFGDASATMNLICPFNPLLKEMNMRLPRLGFRFGLKDAENMEFFGKGPGEAYADRHKGQRYGKFTTTVTDNFVPYIRPIENGAHFGSKYGVVTNNEGKGMIFAPVSEDTFVFNASHFTPLMLEETKHNDELKPLDETMVYLDYRLDIRGSRGIYEELEPERKWDFGVIDFKIAFKPFDNENAFEFINTDR